MVLLQLLKRGVIRGHGRLPGSIAEVAYQAP